VTPSRPAILLDRDGTLNLKGSGYVTAVDEFQPVPGAFAAVGRLCQAGWPVAVVTNQSGIGKGIMTRAVVDEVHRECTRLAEEHGASFDGFYVCPHAPDEGCECRKPLPGLLLEAAKEHDYDLFRSYCIGDSPRDLLAGRAAGATSLLVLTGHGESARAQHPEHLTFPTVAEAVDWILSRRDAPSRP
jgi:histidinol-phosphate phosphatase family protein